MKEILERLTKVHSPVCISIILKTHRIHPENKKDSLLLKNLITETHARLEDEYGKEAASTYTDKLKKLAEKIDHNHNDLGLVLFVSDEIEEYVRLPISPNTRIILDQTFATRSLIRALKWSMEYYVLVLSKGKARLIKASSDKVVKEFEDRGFPVTEEGLLKMPPIDGANATRVSNLTREFFNQVDKAVNRIRKEHPLPVIVCAQEVNYADYLKEADQPDTLLGRVLLKNAEEKALKLVQDAWPHVREMRINKQRERIVELEEAFQNGNYLSDLNEVWTAVQEGRGKTIFVEEGYYQPVVDRKGVLKPVSKETNFDQVDRDDIVDEMIEFTLKFGGDVVFMERDGLAKFDRNIALITRY